MTGKVHVFVGVASLAAFCAVFPKGFEFAGATVLPEIGLVSAAFGSYLPDIDMQRTHMGAKHKTASKVIGKVGGGHRGITHTLLVPVIMAVLMYLIGTQLPILLPGFNVKVLKALSMILMSIIFGAEFGYCMHLFADMFNGKGIPILWPLSKSKISLMDLPSDGAGAWLFGIVLVAIEVAFVAHLGGLF